MKPIEIYTDGACQGNPGRGGWSCIVYDKEANALKYAMEGEEEDWTLTETTNNRMEIHGLLHALYLATTWYSNDVCIIYCDSSYCVNMFNEWINSWASNGWTNSKKEIVKNFDLVKKLYEYKKIDFPNFHVVKCKGHTEDDIGNQLADAYAVSHYTGNASKIVEILKKNNIKNEIPSI